MEDNNYPTYFTFDSPKGQSSYIKVIGVGGGGGNAVKHMYEQGIEGVDFIICNTDMKALNASPVPNKIPLGSLGLGAGGKPEKGRKAAEGKADDIREALSHNTQMLFITAGMGGGTGTGAAPVIAQIAKSIDLQNEENEKILVVAIVTRPFEFEGDERCEQAEAGIEALRQHVDSVIVINNEKLRTFGKLTKSNAFAMADDILLTAAKSLAEIITKEGSVQRDFQDVKTVMENSGTALMGIGKASGENRAHDAIEAATTSVLLDDSDINGAKSVLLYYSYSHEYEMTIEEMTEVADYVKAATGGKAKILWGDCFDDSLGEDLKVILIATGFTKNEIKQHTLDEEPEAKPAKAEAKPQPQPKPDDEGMMVIKRDDPAPANQSIPTPQNTQHVPDIQNNLNNPSTLNNPTIQTTPATPNNQATPTPQPAPGKKNIIPLYDDDDEPAAAPHASHQAKAPQAHVGSIGIESDSMVGGIHIIEAKTETAVAEPVAVPVSQAPHTAPVSQATPVEKPAEKPIYTAPANQGAAANPFTTAFRNDNDVTTAADRIRIIHDMLRNNPNGADIVQRMNVVNAESDPLFEGRHSSVREGSTMAIRADGTIAKNDFILGKGID